MSKRKGWANNTARPTCCSSRLPWPTCSTCNIPVSAHFNFLYPAALAKNPGLLASSLCCTFRILPLADPVGSSIERYPQSVSFMWWSVRGGHKKRHRRQLEKQGPIYLQVLKAEGLACQGVEAMWGTPGFGQEKDRKSRPEPLLGFLQEWQGWAG